jgi:2-C-methyl-D-erythritol 2,4-cyclodiphosphate synthase
MVGLGYDVHKLAKGESFILGGVEIKSEIGTIAHSDGDVLLHSVCDAILGAAGLGDIGEHFPDTDQKYKKIDSMELYKQVLKMIARDNLRLINIDVTIVLEKPKLSPYKKYIQEKIAEASGIDKQRVNIKATTNEKMGFAGRAEGIAVYSICELQEAID